MGFFGGSGGGTNTTVETNVRTPTINESPFSIQGEKILGSNFSTQIISTDPGALAAFGNALQFADRSNARNTDVLLQTTALAQSGILTQGALASQSAGDVLDAGVFFAQQGFSGQSKALDVVQGTKFRAETPQSQSMIFFVVAAAAIVFLIKK